MPVSRDTPGERLQRVLADAGVAARRACEAMIEQGRVRVNGEVVTRLPVFVDPHADRIEVDGRPLRPPQRKLYLMVHKPARTLVTASDEPGMGRATVMDLVDHPSKAHLFPVGRLDFDTTGLVILTNDGELANRLTHPRFGVTKTYLVAVRGEVDHAGLQAIREKAALASARDDQERGRAARGPAAPGLEVMKREPGKTVLRVTLHEARNRQLRDILAHLGMPVKKMTRTAIGGVELKGLALGRWRELTRDELRDLRAAARGQTTPGSSPRPGAPRPTSPRSPRSAGPRPGNTRGGKRPARGATRPGPRRGRPDGRRGRP